MGDKLRYTMSGKITDAAAFQATAKRMVQEVEASEPGTLAYEWFADDDRFIIHEIFEDSDAFITHFGNASESGMLDEMLASCEVDDVAVLTTPSPAAKEITDQFGARYLRGVGGVVR